MTVSYNESFLSLPTSPGNLAGGGETMLASVYRHAGLAFAFGEKMGGHGKGVIEKAAALREQVKRGRVPPGALINLGAFRRVLNNFAEAPRYAGGKGRDHLHLVPLVPATAACSGYIRLRGNPWNPGRLVYQCLQACGDDGVVAVQELERALQVGEDDDPWAKVLQHDLGLWLKADIPPSGGDAIPKPHQPGFGRPLQQPSGQFARDLVSICRLKSKLTRRSWVACLDSLVRLGTVLQTVWLCRANQIVWAEVEALLSGRERTPDEAVARTTKALSAPLCEIEDRMTSTFTSLAGGFFRARTSFEMLGEPGTGLGLDYPVGASHEGLAALFAGACRASGTIPPGRLAEIRDSIDAKQAELACKRGYSKNLREFWIYTLRQRQTARQQDREYDQGYWTTKSGDRGGSLILRPGPLALLVLVHACCESRPIPTVSDLLAHLARYGIHVSTEAINTGHLGRTLRRLGTVVDSPDAEKGMSLLSPLE